MTGNDCPAVIFCGGDNLRFGRLAGIRAKSLLPAYDTPLLWRLIDQLRAAGFRRIVTATTPRLAGQISESIVQYGRDGLGEVTIDVVASAEQKHGVIFGLLGVLRMWSCDRGLSCLGDIFFLSNPFPALCQQMEAEYGCLGVAPAAFDGELLLGGIVVQEEGRIRSILERPVPAVSGHAFRWSGIALFHRTQALADLERFAPGLPDDSPPGEFFEFQRGRGRDLRGVPGPDFVNVNSPDHLLLASLYARMEAGPAPELSSSLREAAVALRRELARRMPSGLPR